MSARTHVWLVEHFEDAELTSPPAVFGSLTSAKRWAEHAFDFGPSAWSKGRGQQFAAVDYGRVFATRVKVQW